jgi:hypothetical protein
MTPSQYRLGACRNYTPGFSRFSSWLPKSTCPRSLLRSYIQGHTGLMLDFFIHGWPMGPGLCHLAETTISMLAARA